MKFASSLRTLLALPALAATAALLFPGSARADVVINEVLHDSEPNTVCNEFIELHNTGPGDADLSGWFFSNGVDYTFPANTMLNEGDYVVVAADPATILAVFSAQALGPWTGGLQNEGESIVLRNAAGDKIDEVSYTDTFPWPIGALGTGRSMELINPALDNDLGGSWRETQPPAVLPELTYFSEAGTWSYRPGDSAAPADWADRDFVEDGEWLSGQTPMGFGSGGQELNTIIDGMQTNYSSVYLRRTFTVAPGEIPQVVRLRHNVDDGFIAYVNGVEVARVRANGATGSFDDTASSTQSPEGEWAEVDFPAGSVEEGENVLAILTLNQSLSSSDFACDFELIRPLIAAPASVPSPGARNSAFANNAPPQIRQVDHSPKMPMDSEAAVITAKVSDPDGVGSVNLEYQLVLPGAYIPALLAKPHNTLLSNPNGPRDPNPAYSDPANWTSVAMVDDGTSGDAVAGDDIFTATLPTQVNRTLVRYRIIVEDSLGSSVRVPYEDDPSLNFAYFVYNGVPDFVANTRSVTGQVPYTHPKEVLTSLPVYTMLTTQADYEQCVAYSGTQIPSNNFDARSAFNWGATFVYEGVVYDNIAYRLRQRNDRYGGGGKRSFRFRFNDGKHIQLHDLEGNPYPTKWRVINSHKMTGSRGGGANFGLYENVNSLLWNLTGTPAPRAHWYHFRIVKGAEEQPPGTNGQHLGDFYGLLIAMENYDVRYLEGHDLERGNLYKLKTGGNDGLSIQRYQAKEAVDDANDFLTIINQLRNTQSDQWLRDHVNWDSWYRYHAIVDAVRHYDVSNGITTNNGEHLKNRAYYFQPDPSNPLGKLNVLPWDADTTWGFNWNGGWDWPKNAMADREEFNKEYKNVVREIRDLVWQEDQINPLLESLESKLTDFTLADRDRWTSAQGSPNPGSQSDGPIANRINIMKNFAFVGGSWNGGNDAMRDYVYNASGVLQASTISQDSNISGQQGRDAYLDALAFDPSVPDKPTITYTGDPGFPTDGLSFQASPFADPQGADSFSAMEWRVAEMTPLGGGTVSFFERGADWSYLDDGSDQGTAWREANFDDGIWASGPAPFGYGGVTNTVIATPIDFGPNAADKYVTTYFRRTIEVAEPDRFENFTFKINADDGALVFVNGVEVVRDRFNAGLVVEFDTPASSNGNEGVYDEFEVPSEFFTEGTNVIAVEIHQSSASSSDMGFDMELDATERTIPVGASLLFEWNADWKSGELAVQQAQIEIPTLATRESRLYRARVRYKDNTDRWSNWSDPLEFTTSLPDIQPLLDNLVISEFMYHPSLPTPTEAAAGYADEDEFEYIELQNVSASETLLLTDVRFTKGIDFDFPPGTMLAPGEYILVVRNQAAFEFRYGGGLPIAGDYQDNAENNLSNGGERLKLSFGGGTPIRELVYDDSAPWPAAADGSGPSLVLVNPETVPDHALAASWAASLTSGGSPGAAESAGETFSQWLAGFGIVDDSPTLDSDKDGLENLLEFGLAGNPVQSEPGERPAAGDVEIGGEAYFTVTFRRPTNAAGISLEVEFSTDLSNWTADGVRIQSSPGGGNTVVEVWRSADPITATAKMYGRVRVTE